MHYFEYLSKANMYNYYKSMLDNIDKSGMNYRLCKYNTLGLLILSLLCIYISSCGVIP